MIAAWIALVGCVQDYRVTLEPTSATPLPVVLAPRVEMPAGILVIASATAFRNDEQLDDDAAIELGTPSSGVLEISTVASEAGVLEWALAGVAPGTAQITPLVDGHEAEPIEVVITEQ